MYRALWRKITCRDKASYDSTPPCTVNAAANRVCVAVCCSVLQRVAVCCSVLQCVAVCCSVLQ